MKKILKTSFIFLLTIAIISWTSFGNPSIAEAAIVHDTDSTKIVNGFAASPTNTWSHTTTAGSTLGVLACSIWQDVPGSGTVGSATYNGSTITAVNSTLSGAMYSYIGYIVNPTSGVNTVSVTVSGNIDGFKCSFSTYSGTNTSSPVDTSALGVTGTTPYTSVSQAITTANAGELVVAQLSKFGVQALTVGGGQTTVMNDVTGSISGATGQQIVATASTVTPSWTMASNSNDWSIVAVAFKASSGGGGGGGSVSFIIFDDL